MVKCSRSVPGKPNRLWDRSMPSISCWMGIFAIEARVGRTYNNHLTSNIWVCLYVPSVNAVQMGKIRFMQELLAGFSCWINWFISVSKSRFFSWNVCQTLTVNKHCTILKLRWQGISLVIQWLWLCTPSAETQVWSLLRELDPTWHR